MVYLKSDLQASQQGDAILKHNCFVFASVSACFQMAVPMGDVAHRFCCSVSNLSNALFAWVSLSVGKEPLCKKGGVDMPRSCFLRNLTF